MVREGENEVGTRRPAGPRRTARGSVLALLPALPLLPALLGRGPDQIHLTLRGDPATAITVAWHTYGAVSSAAVQFGTTASYGSEAPAASHASSGIGYIHEADLARLSPDTLYHYRVRDDDEGWSADRTFRTAPPTGQPATFEFTAVGDIGVTGRSKRILGQMARGAPRLHLLLGDLTYANTGPPARVQETIDAWFNLLEPAAAAAPAMPAWGGHEHDLPDTILNYLNRFALPEANEEQFYALDIADAHIVMSNAILGGTPDTTQGRWLRSDLAAAAANPGIRWRILCSYMPLYSSGVHGSDGALRAAWAPLIERYGVDLVLTAHDHDYERTFPIRAGAAVGAPEIDTYVDPGAPVYVVAGGGGKGPRFISSPRPPWSAWREDRTNFHLRIRIDGKGSLQVRALREDGEEMDRFTLRKAPRAPGNRPPSLATRVFPTGGPVPLRVSFEADAADPDRDPVSVRWDFGDGEQGEGPRPPPHTYGEPGAFRARAIAEDGRGHVSVRTLRVVASRGGAALGTFCDGVWRRDRDRNDRWEGLDFDLSFAFGTAGALPVAGDFRGDGEPDVGIFSNGTWNIDGNDNRRWDGPPQDRAFSFGAPGDVPVTGDWNGDGRDAIGVVEGGRWLLDGNENGAWDGPPADRSLQFGEPGDFPVVGDWDGDGRDQIGVVRRGRWYLDWNGNGTWDGPDLDRTFDFGEPGDLPVSGDWDGNGTDEVGVFRRGNWLLDQNGNRTWDGPPGDRNVFFGPDDGRPLTYRRRRGRPGAGTGARPQRP